MEDKIKWIHPEAIIDCETLKTKVYNKNIRIYDCTMYLHYTDDDPNKPYDVESGYQNFLKKHIPNSSFLDLQNDLSNSNSKYKFTLPELNDLAKSFKNLGIGDPFHIILYSNNGLQWATRVWWMITILGYKRVSILNGGFKRWLKLGYYPNI